MTTTETGRPRTDPGTLAEAYLRAWNDHDGAAVAALFAPGGTYTDPTLPAPLSGEAVAAYVTGLTEAFPDLHFAPGRPVVDGDRVVLPWRMQGTNTAPLPGWAEATGGTCDLAGVDVLESGPEGISAVTGYFDQKTFVEQLGLRTLVLPPGDEATRFGMSLRVSTGRTEVPGALTMTWIDVDTDEQEAEVQVRGKEVVTRLAEEPGFLGIVATFAGHRGHTLAAWTSADAAREAVARNARHREGTRRVLGGELGTGGFTGIWEPSHLNTQFRRCPDCGAQVRVVLGAATGRCRCGGAVRVTPYL